MSLDIGLSPIMCVILGKRQFVALLRSQDGRSINAKTFKWLVSVRSEMVSSREPETLWITLGNFFVTRFSLIGLFFLSLFSFLYFVFFLLLFFVLFSALFFFIFYNFKFYFKFSMQKIRHESQTFPSLAVSVPESFETNMTNSWGSWSVAMSRVPVSTIISSFCKMQD